MPSYLQSFEHEPFVRMLYVQYQITNIFTNTKSMWSTVLLGANSCKYGLIWDILWRAQIHDRKYMCLNINSHLITFLWHGCEQPNLKWWIARHKYEFFLFLTNIFLFTKFRCMYSIPVGDCFIIKRGQKWLTRNQTFFRRANSLCFIPMIKYFINIFAPWILCTALIAFEHIIGWYWKNWMNEIWHL